MNIISHINSFYLKSAIEHLLVSVDKQYLGSGVTLSLLDHIILFNDKLPSESLMRLSHYSEFKSGDTILVVTDEVPAEIVARFIHKECELIVLGIKSNVNEWLAALMLSPEYRQKTIKCGGTHKPLLTDAEKRFLNILSTVKARKTLKTHSAMTVKTASAYKRSVMRKLGVKHTSQLLNYVNTNYLTSTLSFL